MNIVDRFKKLLKKDEEKEFVKQLAESYIEQKENGEENPIDKTVAKIMESIKNSPNPNKTAEKILQAALEAEDMPNRVPQKVAIEISMTDGISDSTITNAAEKSDVDISDDYYIRIYDEGDLAPSERLRIIKTLESKEKIKDKILNEFEIIYRVCYDKRDDEIVSRIKELKQIAEDNDISINFKEQTEKVIAKKMAENYYNDNIKGTRIYTLSQVLPATEMLDDNLPSLVEKEYNKIEEEQDKVKEGRFNKENLRVQIIKEIAKNVGNDYKENGVYIIPQTRSIKEITREEEEVFVRTIRNYAGGELDNTDLKEIRDQIRGIIKNEETKKMMLTEAINNMPNKEKYIEPIAKIMKDEQKIKTVVAAEESGLLDELGKLEGERRQLAIAATKDALQNAREKNEEHIKESKNAKQSKQIEEENER